MEPIKRASILVIQVLLLASLSACVDSSQSNYTGGGPVVADKPEQMQINIPSSPRVAPSDVMDQVVFEGTGGSEGVGCPCVSIQNSTLYLEGFSPNQSLRLVAYDEYEPYFGTYFAEWQILVDSSGFLAIPLNGDQSNIRFIAYDPVTGKQKGPANIMVHLGTPPSSTTTIAWIYNEVPEVNLRRSPGYIDKDESQDVITKIPAGEPVEILDGPFQADGLDWWLVSWNGMEGYLADHTGSGQTILIFP